MLSYWGRFLSIMDRWMGKKVDFDKVYGNQCVDWVKQFAMEQYGIVLSSFSGSAYKGWITGSPFDNKWERIVYKKGLVPEIGDIVFLKPTKNNQYGHVCVADNLCDKTKLYIIEQNAGNGNGNGIGANAITRRNITYTDSVRGTCLGWFHKK